MGAKRILIIEDEISIAELVELYLRKNGYETMRSVSAEDALKILDRQTFDLILLDLMLPGMDGTSFCKKYRNDPKYAQAPIIMLTARSEDADIVNGLEYGADDYITKPFSMRVLLARINARLRDTGLKSKEKSVSLRGISLNVELHEAAIEGEPIDLTANEFTLLHLFLSNPGRVYSRDDIINHLNGPGYSVTDRAIDVQLVGLRKKLGDKSTLIETVRGVGYRFVK
jgi:Response regulators consisting of a CheY-like receiver domain and a winged-helix DNA-binding domain